MLRGVELRAATSGLRLRSRESEWCYHDDSPHISELHYELATYDEDDELVSLGTADGYRISQNWTVENDLQIWDEADAVDGDVVRYVEALVRELRACEVTFGFAPDLASAQRITILAHVEAAKGVDSAELVSDTAACLALIDAPVLMLVDPWPASDERRLAKGKLAGRGNVFHLLELGFVRMVGSRFLWAWNRQFSEGPMSDYSYEKLAEAARKGALREVLKTPLSEEVYGELPEGVAEMMGLPDPDELTSE